MHTFLIRVNFCIFTTILLSGLSSATDYRYAACVPHNCGNGPNVTYPFYIRGRQESFCGFPGFGSVNCSQGFPVLQFREGGEYVIQDIFYQTQTLRVSDSAVLSSKQYDHDGWCLPGIRNLTVLPTDQLKFADNVTKVHILSRCNDLVNVSRDDRAGCGEIWDLAMNGTHGNITGARENCHRSVAVPVEEVAEGGHSENLVQLLNRGFVLNWKTGPCNECVKSGGRCGYNETTVQFKCFCPNRPRGISCKPRERRSRSKLIIATVITGGAVFFLTCLLCFMAWSCKKIKNLYFSRNLSKPDVETGRSYFGIPIFSYADLQLATKNFDSSNELGDGGFGTVYYGKLQDRREVAVKRLYEHNTRRMEQFMNEIKILTCLRHHNLVSLYGCTSRTSKELLLVYEYIPNGTLADHLHGERPNTSSLNWDVRLNIAIQTAGALSYLHKSDIIHRDVKTDNILLDNNFCVKVADFGLSRLFPNDATHVSTAPQGTLGYVDPEYYQCYQLTDKSDVYSFGVVLIELVSSMPAVDINRHRPEINLANMAINKIQMRAFDQLIDRTLGYENDADVAQMTTAVAELAFRCLQEDKNMRPSMDEILDGLKEIQDVRKDNAASYVTGNVVPASPETDDAVLLRGN